MSHKRNRFVDDIATCADDIPVLESDDDEVDPTPDCSEAGEEEEDDGEVKLPPNPYLQPWELYDELSARFGDEDVCTHCAQDPDCPHCNPAPEHIQISDVEPEVEDVGDRRVRRWAATIQLMEGHDVRTPSGCEGELWENLPNFKTMCDYCIVAVEKAPSTGKLHLQAYFEFRNPQRFSGLKKAIPSAHWEPAHQDGPTNVRYCKKGEGTPDKPKNPTFYEFGTVSQGTPGKRNDLKAITDIVVERHDAGAALSERELALVAPTTWVRNYRGIEAFCRAVRNGSDRRPVPLVIWVTGAPGQGKSRMCDELWPDAYWRPAAPPCGPYWYDGYLPALQETIICDDVEGEAVSHYLRLADRYPLQLPTKGSFVPCKAKYIVYTNNAGPEFAFSGPAQAGAVERRIGYRLNLSTGHDGKRCLTIVCNTGPREATAAPMLNVDPDRFPWIDVIDYRRARDPRHEGVYIRPEGPQADALEDSMGTPPRGGEHEEAYQPETPPLPGYPVYTGNVYGRLLDGACGAGPIGPYVERLRRSAQDPGRHA